MKIDVRTNVLLDEKTNSKLSKFAEERAINKSACIRMILNEYFLEKEGNQ